MRRMVSTREISSLVRAVAVASTEYSSVSQYSTAA